MYTHTIPFLCLLSLCSLASVGCAAEVAAPSPEGEATKGSIVASPECLSGETALVGDIQAQYVAPGEPGIPMIVGIVDANDPSSYARPTYLAKTTIRSPLVPAPYSLCVPALPSGGTYRVQVLVDHAGTGAFQRSNELGSAPLPAGWPTARPPLHVDTWHID